jgi:hypothetical protein
METKPSFGGGEQIIIGSLVLIFMGKLIEHTWKWLLSHPRYLYALIGCPHFYRDLCTCLSC